MNRLKGKIALITGAAKGLGEADSRLFAEEGARVIIADVDVAAGERLASQIGPAARFLALDVRSEEDFKVAIDRIVSDYGRLDILVNNAGIVEAGNPETVRASDYHRILAVSLDGTIFGCKYAIAAMTASGGGSIINMSSVASIQGSAYSAAYSAAKGAIEAYTRSVTVHCKLNNLAIRCNSVHPGAFSTPMLDSMLAKMSTQAGDPSNNQFRNRVAGVMGEPRDVAWLILFLASDESRFINGQRFVIDNGDSITPLSARG